jgi:hypothetical protein
MNIWHDPIEMALAAPEEDGNEGDEFGTRREGGSPAAGPLSGLEDSFDAVDISEEEYGGAQGPVKGENRAQEVREGGGPAPVPSRPGHITIPWNVLSRALDPSHMTIPPVSYNSFLLDTCLYARLLAVMSPPSGPSGGRGMQAVNRGYPPPASAPRRRAHSRSPLE